MYISVLLFTHLWSMRYDYFNIEEYMDLGIYYEEKNAFNQPYTDNLQLSELWWQQADKYSTFKYV